MLTLVEKILFIVLAVASLAVAYGTFRQAARVIGRGEGALRWEGLPARVVRALDVFLTQRTVFRTRPIPSLLHAFVAWGFTYYVLINLVDVARGFVEFEFLGGGAPGGIYRLLGDVLSVLTLLGVAYFLVRRFVAHAPALRFHENIRLHPAALPGLRRDSLIVGLFILTHVGARWLGESVAIARAGDDAWQPLAGALAGVWGGLDHGALEALEHGLWWIALGSILLFIPYFPYSKHMHLFMGPLNYLTKPERRSPGALDPLDFADEAREQFGAARLEHLQQTHLFDAFACIMCNRCQDVCPATLTGKELSPSALEINKRTQIRATMPALAGGAASPPLLDYAITESAVWACTACGACIEICPVGDEPMFDIMDIRRNQVLVEGEFPPELQGAFKGMETAGNPWQMGGSRLAWAEGLDVPTVEQAGEYEILYWVGCAGSFEPRAQQVARALVGVLRAAGVRFAVLGEAERCTGDTARRAGNEYLFAEMAQANIATLNAAHPPRILVTCPHCYHTLAQEYPQFGGVFDVVHHTQFLEELIRAGRLRVPHDGAREVTYHDPCYLGRQNGILEAPRAALSAAGAAINEMPRTGTRSFCCGAGGAQFWKEEEPGAQRVSGARYAEAAATGAPVLATGCPFCLRMFADAGQEAQFGGGPAVRDVVEILAEGMGVNS